MKNILSYPVLLISLLIHKLLHASNDVNAISSVISINIGFISEDNSLIAEVYDIDYLVNFKIMHSLYLQAFIPIINFENYEFYD